MEMPLLLWPIFEYYATISLEPIRLRCSAHCAEPDACTGMLAVAFGDCLERAAFAVRGSDSASRWSARFEADDDEAVDRWKALLHFKCSAR